MSHDWLPKRREEQLAMANKWVTELPNHKGAWTVTSAEITELKELADTAQEALNRLVSGSAVDVARARETFAALVRRMRFLHSRKFFSPPMEDPDYVRLGLRPPDRVRTEHTVVNELVEFDLSLRGIREIVVNFWVKGTDHRAKPAGYDGAVLVWDTLDAPPERPTDLAEHTMASRTPHIIEFDEADRGKTVYIALCWQNERGIRGPWSETQTAVVP
ncbi:MAG: hypothetical protein LBB89_05125 [Treponema sp.]|jgi:hypothetical protein|nr:hypothetical protein [Treponema sp.]